MAIGLSITPQVQDWEEDTGLSWLFHARGVTPAPQSVVVISIDKSSSSHFNLPNLTRKWPRILHVDLLNRLKKAGARVVAFDIFFKSSRPGDQDARLAQAIKASGNIILFEFLQKQMADTVDQQGRKSSLMINELQTPLEIFANAAVALAPNPLPKVPVKVSQFWKFIPEAGDAPTLPVVAYQIYMQAYLPSFVRIVEDLTGKKLSSGGRTESRGHDKTVSLMIELREFFVRNPWLLDAVINKTDASGFEAGKRQTLLNLARLYGNDATQFISYYGPARSIRTIPFYQVLASDRVLKSLKDKLVFVGFSERRQWEQQDGFYSVYSNRQGLDISGVEITASAAANLMEGISVQRLSLGSHFIVLAVFSLLSATVYLYTRGIGLPVVMLLLSGLYFMIASQLFSHLGLWLPLTVPLLVQLPAVLLLGMTWNYQELNKERNNIQRAFGYYLPETVVDRLARDIAGHGLGGQLMHGICLSTDAQQYTTLSEQLTPQDLTTLMNEYYEAIFKPVRLHGGIISDVVGDSVMALWAGPTEERQHREHAVRAAIEMLESVKQFNRQHPDYELPTRVGLHYGTMVIGNVGAVDHYEYRAVGDIVNTTSRIEGMNKYLGTRLLVSGEVIDGLEGFSARNVGRFILKGKTVPLQLFEICRENESQGTRDVWSVFDHAIELFQSGEWEKARQEFARVLEYKPDDGPSHFYVMYCDSNKTATPENWHGVINMGEK